MPDEEYIGYMPIPCPVCNRMRLELFLNKTGEGRVIVLRCEKCGADTELVADTYEVMVDKGA